MKKDIYDLFVEIITILRIFKSYGGKAYQLIGYIFHNSLPGGYFLPSVYHP